MALRGVASSRPQGYFGDSAYSGSVKPPNFDPAPDIRLIAADMDGTLLDENKELHHNFWPTVEALFERGISFAAASGRQYHTLYRLFGEVADELIYIAENGAYLVHGSTEIAAQALDNDLVRRVVLAVRTLTDEGADLGVVVCGKDSAYIERNHPAFRAETDEYYVSLALLPDLLDRPVDDILKVAVYDFGSAEQHTWPALSSFAAEAQVVLSGQHWVDVQSLGTNKGAALRHVQRVLGITSAQTMVFGDFLNDLELMDSADYSFAMDNAHPLLRERARFVAPPNTENGVVRTITAALRLP